MCAAGPGWRTTMPIAPGIHSLAYRETGRNSLADFWDSWDDFRFVRPRSVTLSLIHGEWGKFFFFFFFLRLALD
jgi:hypothetical protein